MKKLSGFLLILCALCALFAPALTAGVSTPPYPSGGATLKILAADEVRTANTTLAPIGSLTQTLTPGTYYFRYLVDLTQSSTGGFKFDFSGTATTSGFFSFLTVRTQGDGLGTAVLIRRITTTGSAQSVGTNNTDINCMAEGVVTVTATGTFDLRFAQNTATGTATARVRSVLSCQRIN